MENENNADEKGTATAWINKIKDSRQAFAEWNKRCDRIAERYAQAKMGKTTQREFKIFWSNIEVLKPSLYARSPVPVVVPRFKDLKELPRQASEVLERSLVTNFELQDMDYTMKLLRDDFLLFARATPWLRYVAQGGEDNAASEESQVKFSESVTFDHVGRMDFLHDPARKWSEVGWVAKRAYLERKAFSKRFPDAVGKGVRSMKLEDALGQKHGSPKVAVWEIWDKMTKKVIWIAENHADILDQKDPHLDLEGFFPCPRPIYGTLPEKSLVPVPDFVYYKDQVEEVNELTARISKLSEALKLKGFYAGGEGTLKAAIEKAVSMQTNDAILVPVSNMAALGNKGLKDSIVWLPFVEVAGILKELIGLRKVLIQDIYEITGISDIVRGATDPNETASAQKIKAQWGSVRIRERQGEIARLARDGSRIMAEIMAENFQAETFMSMSQVDLQTDAAIAQQIQQVQNGAAQQLAQVPEEQRAQMQQQFGPQVQAHVQKLQQTITIEKVMQLFSDQKTRTFTIEIETDSTIQPDEDGEKQRRTEFLTAIGAFVAQILPMVQQVPQTAHFAAEALRFAAGGFRAGRQLEGVIDEMADQLKQMAKQATEQQGKPPEPTPEQKLTEAKIKGEAEKTRMLGAKNQKDMMLIDLKSKQVMQQMQTPPPATPPVDTSQADVKHAEIAMRERVESRKLAANIEVKRLDIEAKAILASIQQEGNTQDPIEAVAPVIERMSAVIASLQQPGA